MTNQRKLQSPTVIVTGGAGYIAAPSVFYLVQAGYKVAAIDRKPFSAFPLPQLCADGSVTYYQGDIADKTVLERVFKEQRPAAACLHFAAEIEVSTSLKEPELYYHNNVAKTALLLQHLRAQGVNRFIFSSSCAVYGVPQELPLTEQHPRNPISPYGRTKLMVEQILEDYAAAYPDFSYASIRYFNAAGALPELNLYERHEPETHLIPRAVAAAQAGIPITICGTDYPTLDGTCIRDYIHIADLATAHLKALQYLERTGQSFACNVGTGIGTSVQQLIANLAETLGKPIATTIAPRRPGDPAVLVADPSYAQKLLDWRPERSTINQILQDVTKFLR